MSKVLLTTRVLAACSIFVIPLASADTIFGVYAGGGYWNTAYSGDIGTDGIDVENDLNLSEEGNSYFYIAIEHPVPLVPNIKLQRTDIQTSGNGTLNISSQFDEISFSTGGVITDLNLSHTDLTFYYEILDNWVSLDLGLTARFFDGEAKITGSAADTLLAVTESIDIDAATPMLYGKAQFDLPFSGLALGANVNFAGFGGNGLIDYNVRISYMPDIIPLVDFGVELGYRSMQLELDGIGDLQTDFTIDGPYLSLIFHF